MLLTYPNLDDEERLVEEATTQLRHDLRHYMEAEPCRWIGLRAPMNRARALIGSNSVEGINVSDEDAIAAIDGEDPESTDRDMWRAVVGYREAMNYILQRRQSPSFAITEDVLLAVHFMICQSDMCSRHFVGNLQTSGEFDTLQSNHTIVTQSPSNDLSFSLS